MGLVYLPGQVSATLPSNISSQTTKQSVMSNGINTANNSSKLESKMESSVMLQSGMMSEPLTEQDGLEKWILSLGVSPANHSLSLARTKEQMTREICGQIPYESLAKYDPDTHAWRTSQTSLFTTTPELFSLDWPRSGTIVNGILYRRLSLEHHTSERESGYLPTPTAREHRDWSQVQILASLDKGDGVAKRICKIGLELNLLTPTDIVGIHPFFVERLMGFPIGWTELRCLEMRGYRKWLTEFLELRN